MHCHRSIRCLKKILRSVVRFQPSRDVIAIYVVFQGRPGTFTSLTSNITPRSSNSIGMHCRCSIQCLKKVLRSMVRFQPSRDVIAICVVFRDGPGTFTSLTSNIAPQRSILMGMHCRCSIQCLKKVLRSMVRFQTSRDVIAICVVRPGTFTSLTSVFAPQKAYSGRL